jgi:hypothetical protein
MSLYHHVRDKEDLLGGVADQLVAGIAIQDQGGWQASLRATIMAARAQLVRHPWAKAVVETRREPGPATIGYIDAVVGLMRGDGCSLELAHHALHVLGGRVLGFSQDLYDDGSTAGQDPAQVALQIRSWQAAFPNVAELALAATHEGGLGGCDSDTEFAFALDLILDGLERRRVAEQRGSGPAAETRRLASGALAGEREVGDPAGRGHGLDRVALLRSFEPVPQPDASAEHDRDDHQMHVVDEPGSQEVADDRGTAADAHVQPARGLARGGEGVGG